MRNDRFDFWRGLDMVLVHAVYEGVWLGTVGTPLIAEWTRFAAGGFVLVAGIGAARVFSDSLADPRTVAPPTSGCCAGVRGPADPGIPLVAILTLYGVARAFDAWEAWEVPRARAALGRLRGFGAPAATDCDFDPELVRSVVLERRPSGLS